MQGKEISVKDLRLGDAVRLSLQKFSDATVYRINEEKKCVDVWRPYVHTSEFSYTGGVVPYIGIEDFSISFEQKVFLVERGGEKK